VKPANLIRAADGTTKLLDFGLVTARDDDDTELTGANVVMGTPDYIAPEQAEDPRSADARADVYALGCTLFHLLSGRVPFAGRGSLRKLDAHRADPLPKLPELPAALNAVLAKMTAKKPADRYATAAEVADALEPFCAARAQPAAAPPRGRARWPVALVIAALALLCVAAAGAGVWVIVRDKDGKEVARVHVPDGGTVEVSPKPPGAPHVEPPAPKKPVALPDKPGAFNTFPAETAADPTPDALSPDGRLISIPVDGNLRQVAALKVYDTASGKLVRTLPTGGNRFTNHLFFPDGKRLITGEITAGGGFRFREWSLTGDPDRLLAHIADPGGWPTFFDLSADGNTFAFSYERPAGVMHARVVDLDSGKTLAEATVPPGQKTYAYARVSADGTRALTGVNVVGAKTATVQLHDLKAGKVLMTAEVKGTDAVIAYPVFLADGTPAAGVYTKGAAARLERYEPATAKLLAQVTMPAGVAYHMLQPSRIGAIAGTERSDLRPVVVDPGTGRIVFDAGKVDPLQNQALSADGRVMAVRSGGKTTVYRIPDGPPPAPADLNKPGVLQYQPPDGRTLSAAQIAPDGRAFLVSRGDRTELFDTATGAKLHAFPGHLGCFALGGTKVLCAAANNRLTVYDRATGKPDRAFAPLGAEVLAVFPVGPDAARVLVAVADRTFRLFDVSRGEQLLSTEFKGEPLYTFTADGKAVLIREPSDTAYKAYDAATGKPVKGFEGLVGRGLVGPFSADGTKAQSWDGKETRVVRVSDGQVVGTVPAHPDGAFAVGYTPDRTATLIYRTNEVLELRDSITGAALSALKVEFPGSRDRLRFLSMSAVSPDGTFALLVATDGHVAAIRLPDPKPAAEPVGERLKLIGPGHSVPTVAFAPDGQTLLTASAPRGEQAANSDVVLWDAATGKELRRLKGHTFAVYGAAFSADGKRVVTGSGYVDGTVRVWDAGTGKELTQIVYPFDDKPHGVYTVAFAPDGKRVYSAGTDKLVRAWDAETGKELLAFEGHPDIVRCLALSPDGKVLASGGSEDRPAVRLWDAATGKELLTLDGHAEQVNAVAFSADGTRLASADCAGAVRVWDARTGKELKVLEGHTGRIDGLAFAPAGRLVTGGHDRTVRVWDAGAGKEVARFDGHTSGIISLAVSPCGRFALTGSDDNSARLWRLPDPKP